MALRGRGCDVGAWGFWGLGSRGSGILGLSRRGAGGIGLGVYMIRGWGTKLAVAEGGLEKKMETTWRLGFTVWVSGCNC